MMAALCSRVVPSTRLSVRRLAVVTRCHVCPECDPNRGMRTGQAWPMRELHYFGRKQPRNQVLVSAANPGSHPRTQSTSGAAYLEDADNVYFQGLKERIVRGDMQMIDVRDKSELDEFGTIVEREGICHIPVLDVEGALQLADGEFRAKYGRPKPRKEDDNIVFTCKKGIRSLKARDTARALGYAKARHYPGGWMEWGRLNNLPYPKE